MSTALARAMFEARLQDLDEYLALLGAIDGELQQGRVPRIGEHERGATISTQQFHILRSSVYLQLYNLVEATVTQCLHAVAAAAAFNGIWHPGDLSVELRALWVRYVARTHKELSSDNRLTYALELCNRLVGGDPVQTFEIEAGGGGNWDDEEIYRLLTTRLGMTLDVPEDVQQDVKRPRYEKLGALQLVRKRRNDLAHGNVSFAECGTDVTLGELQALATATKNYLEIVVQRFTVYIEQHEYVLPQRRPGAAA